MERHERCDDGTVRVTYSDGSVMTVDYRNKQAFLNDRLLVCLNKSDE